jgi:hypothetical protein
MDMLTAFIDTGDVRFEALGNVPVNRLDENDVASGPINR